MKTGTERAGLFCFGYEHTLRSWTQNVSRVSRTCCVAVLVATYKVATLAVWLTLMPLVFTTLLPVYVGAWAVSKLGER